MRSKGVGRYISVALFGIVTAALVIPYIYAAITGISVSTTASNPGNQLVGAPYMTYSRTNITFAFNEGYGCFDYWVKHRIQKHVFWWWWKNTYQNEISKIFFLH